MKYIKRAGRTELSNKDFNLAVFYKDYIILDNACLIKKKYIDFTDSLPARHLFCIDHQPICFNTETKEFNGWKPPAEELDQLIDRASNAGKPITDITIRIEVNSDTYDDYEKCLDDFCNSLNECYIYRIDIREKQRED